MADFGSLSAAQINAGMGFGPGGVGDQSQAALNNIFGNFGSTAGQYAPYPSFGEQSGAGSIYDPAAYATGTRGAIPSSYYDPGTYAPSTPIQQYNNGGYNPYDPGIYAPSPQGNVGARPSGGYYDTPAGKAFLSETYGGGMGSLFDQSAYMPVGMSTQDRTPAQIPSDFITAPPSANQALARQQNWNADQASNTMPQLGGSYRNLTPDQAPGWGNSGMFPVAPAYQPPTANYFGSEEYPATDLTVKPLPSPESSYVNRS